MTEAGSTLGIVVPALNAAGTLAATLASLAPIRKAGATVLVVDGGSTDGTPQIAAAKDVPVLPAAGNMYGALNAGFHAIHADWYTWINADDLLYSDRISPEALTASTADVLYGRVDFIDEAGRFLHSWLSAAPHHLLHLYQAGYSPLLQQGTLFRRRVFETLDGFAESYRFVADADFWWRALENGFRFACSTHPPVAAFRLHAGQLSQRHFHEMRKEHDLMVVAHGGRKRSLRSAVAACLWRSRNLSSYAIRALRRHDIDGSLRLPGSYDITRGH